MLLAGDFPHHCDMQILIASNLTDITTAQPYILHIYSNINKDAFVSISPGFSSRHLPSSVLWHLQKAQRWCLVVSFSIQSPWAFIDRFKMSFWCTSCKVLKEIQLPNQTIVLLVAPSSSMWEFLCVMTGNGAVHWLSGATTDYRDHFSIMCSKLNDYRYFKTSDAAL